MVIYCLNKLLIYLTCVARFSINIYNYSGRLFKLIFLIIFSFSLFFIFSFAVLFLFSFYLNSCSDFYLCLDLSSCLCLGLGYYLGLGLIYAHSPLREWIIFNNKVKGLDNCNN